jgi:RNA polymerase sigma-32 factor
MHEFILRNWRIVKIATTKAQRKLFFNLRSAKKRLGWLSHDEAIAVARDLGVSPEVVTQMEGRLASNDMSFDGDSDDEDDAWSAPANYLEAEGADPAETVARDEWRTHSTERLSEALEALDERSRDIVKSRWLGEEKLTLHDLAERYSVSAERVRQLEQNALKKLRGALEAA